MSTPAAVNGALIGLAEAARLLGLKERLVYYLVESGELPAIRHASRTGNGRGAIRIDPAAIGEYITRHAATGADPAVAAACAEVNAVLDAIRRISDPRERYDAAGELVRELDAACKSLTGVLTRDGTR